jgi:hypothetical protein
MPVPYETSGRLGQRLFRHGSAAIKKQNDYGDYLVPTDCEETTACVLPADPFFKR